MNQPKKKRVTGKRLGRIVLKTILFIFAFFLLVVVLILTPPVQNFARKKAVAYLERTLHTKVEIGKIYIGLPKNIILEDFYIEDLQKDTLLAGDLVKVNMGIFKLIFSNEIDIQSIELKNITAKIKRELPDTTFNYQFIINAFSPVDTAAVKKPADSTASIAIRSVTLDKARLLYKDVVTGSDMEAWIDHFDTKVDKIDPVSMTIDIPRINISGMAAKVYQSRPLLMPGPLPGAIPPPVVTPVNAPVPHLSIGEINIEKTSLDYRNDVSALYTNAVIGSLLIDPGKIDFEERIIDFNIISLENSTAVMRIGKKQAARVMVKEAEEIADSSIESGWSLNIASFSSINNNLRFDNDNVPRQHTGMDYAHLKVSPFVLQARDFSFSDDSVYATIEKASFREQSGFELQELKVNFLYSNTGAYLRDLYLKTPGTELQRNIAIQYASLDALQKDIGNLRIDLDVDQSRILVKDILTFAPSLRSQPAFADPGTTWYINSRVKGRVADLDIGALQVQGLRDTKIDVSGRVRGLPDMNQLSADLTIRNISSSRRDINLFMPAKLLPQQITLPSRLSMSGTLKGNTSDINTALSLRTDLGDAVIRGRFRQINDPKKIGYDATVQTRSLDLGTILQDPQNLGPITATFAINGRGLDPNTASAGFKGTIHSAVLKQYNYRNMQVDGTLRNQQVALNTFIMDPNIHVTANATGSIAKDNPTIHISAMIDSIKTAALHLTPDPFIYRGKIDGDFTSADPDDLVGNLLITQSLVVQNEQRIQLDSVQLIAARTDSGHSLKLTSDIAIADLQGNYRLTQLGNIFLRAIDPYFSILPGDAPVSNEPYDFSFDAYVVNSLPLKPFLPGLEKSDSLSLRSRFSSINGWNATLSAPSIDYAESRIRGLELNAGTGTSQDSIKADIVVREITSGSMVLRSTTLNASLANNMINFTTDITDNAGKSRYNFTALFQQPKPDQYSFSFASQGLLLNYQRWNVAADNRIMISPTDVHATNFVLSQGEQQLSINSLSQNAGSPLQVKFTDFKLATVTGFVQSDSTLINGNMNGMITFSDILRDPIFKGDLTINNLSIKNDTVGNAVIHVNNTTPDTYVANATLSGRGTDVKLDGKYYVREANNSNFDLDLNIVHLPVATAEAFSGGAIRYGTGDVNGRFSVTGTIEQPKVKGDLNFDQAGFNISMLNNYFRIDKEKIEINENGIRFDRFEIRDSLNNPLILDGTATTSNFKNFNFNFTIRSNDFQALNSTKQDNNLFYGKLFFNSNLRVRGTEETPIIDGSVTVNEKTKMTVVLPQREPGIVEREGVIQFVDFDAPLNDSLFLAAYDSLNTTPFRGFDITANIEVNKEAEFNLVIDEGNGDFLNVKGEASLTTGIDPSGKLTLSGAYELEEGSYELTFNFIKRKFNIEKGSKIVWLGEPTDAEVDITAKYIANTAPLDLVKNQLDDNIAVTQRNAYLQKIPFDVLLKMEGKLLKPQISFDIQLPEDRDYRVSTDVLTTVRTKLEILRQEEGEMNKQVFALLLLNRFIGENPFNSSGSDFSANSFARQSVSKLLTEQLNKLAGGLIEGVDLNFDIISSDDYTSGDRRDRTDLNVGLSKRLLNDRLSVSVGSNFELEGPPGSNQQANNIAGNVAINYQLSQDGRYMLRAYRKNEYEGIIDGYIIETGVSFIISVDYNRFRQIFLNKEDRRKKRQIRKSNREVKKEEGTEQMINDKQKQESQQEP